MRHLFTTILIILGTAWGAGAQLVPASGDIPVNDPGLKYGIQTAIEVRKELSRDLELNAGVEARFRGDFFYDKQLRFFAGAEYKLAKRISVEGAYTMIRRHKDGDRTIYRHRIEAGLNETIKISKAFKITFSEKLLWTHRASKRNKYQTPQNDLATKLRVKFTISPNKKWNIFFYNQLRITFNEPRLADVYYDPGQMLFTDATGSPVGESGWFLDGFSKVKLNRVRNAFGADFKINRHHKIRLTAIYDLERELDIDANRKGTVIKSLVDDRRNMLHGRLEYIFTF